METYGPHIASFCPQERWESLKFEEKLYLKKDKKVLFKAILKELRISCVLFSSAGGYII